MSNRRPLDRFVGVVAVIALIVSVGPQAIAGEGAEVQVLSFDARSLPSSVRPPKQETVVGGLHWRDSRGEGYLVQSSRDVSHKDPHNPGERTNGTYLYARLYALHGTKAERLRVVKDGIGSCDVDLSVSFIGKANAVTDLDRDGVAEVTFAYGLACVGGIDPTPIKLLLLEGKDKYILRGMSAVNDGEGVSGGTYQVDRSFKRGPKAFLQHARKLWKPAAGL